MSQSEEQPPPSPPPPPQQQSKKSNYKPIKTKTYLIKPVQIRDDGEYLNMSQDQLINEVKRLKAYCVQLKNLLARAVSQNSTTPPSLKAELIKEAQETAGVNLTTIEEGECEGDEKREEEAAKTQEEFHEQILQQQQQRRATKKQLIKGKKDRPFDHSRFNKRHVLLKFAYLGWNYHGYISQEGFGKTIESYLFDAFMRTKLIEARETSNYHRCGRTDKGVSAFCQVVSIDFRSNCLSGRGVIPQPNSKVTNNDIKNEINYIKLLNGVLPDDIRAIGWCPIEPEFSARFDCVERIYRYYLPKGDLDIVLMRDAGRRLVGEKDYRNFCKMDVGNGVVTFFRRIDNVSLNVLDENPNIYSTVELIVEGSSYLWHQIRCIVAVLLLVGQKKEPPSIIDDLLDIEKYPCKPQYSISSELPLVLFDCHYENTEWIYDWDEHRKLIRHFQDLWTENQTKAVIIKRMIDHIDLDLKKLDATRRRQPNENDEKEISKQQQDEQLTNVRSLEQPYAVLQGRSLSHFHIKFEERQRALSLEKRVEHYVKRRKLDSEVYNKIEEANNLAQSLNIYKPSSTSSSSQPRQLDKLDDDDDVDVDESTSAATTKK